MSETIVVEQLLSELDEVFYVYHGRQKELFSDDEILRLRRIWQYFLHSERYQSLVASLPEDSPRVNLSLFFESIEQKAAVYPKGIWYRLLRTELEQIARKMIMQPQMVSLCFQVARCFSVAEDSAHPAHCLGQEEQYPGPDCEGCPYCITEMIPDK